MGQAVRKSEKSYSFMCGDGGTLAIGEAILDVRPKGDDFHTISISVGLSVMTFRGDQVFFCASGVYSNTGVSRYIETLVLFFLQFSRNW